MIDNKIIYLDKMNTNFKRNLETFYKMTRLFSYIMSYVGLPHSLRG